MLVSIVIPCYRSSQSIRAVVGLCSEVFEGLAGYDCEFVLVDDCSPDDTFSVISQLARERDDVLALTLMRNFGQHNALMCGMNYAHGDLVMGMDDDLQTHPSQIPVILKKMEEGYDIVYGVYRESANGPLKNLSSWLNKTSAQVLLSRPKGLETSNFWLISRAVCDQVIKYKNYNPYVEALFGRMTNRIGNVTIEHHEREHGASNYTLGKLVRLWLSYFNYTVLPLRVMSTLGAATALAGFLFGIVSLVHRLLDPGVPMGWTSLICVMLFFFGMVLLALGIIGEYLGDIVLSLNSSPQFIVREAVSSSREAASPSREGRQGR
ncbi:hypothetical protein HMPREF1008_01212 [Olsenella sp. oral taxon 809 str. F0356]|uniref:glycosyltransferase family 2 protein n=2 Tax=Atopobiaceae TaxID=1643824 RepID=UPI000231EE1E|nr:glycosyltransferase family 2 protein [Olsenella sp. oral taxon 809]EHF01588.1 hypothetical protein HMPREF1008_01212 [Olsenella sp. oral taxon 809 str. F0356]